MLDDKNYHYIDICKYLLFITLRYIIFVKDSFFLVKDTFAISFFSNNNNNNETGNHLSKYDCLYDICWAFYVICYSYSGIQANVRYFIWRQVSVGRRIFLLKNVESKQLRLHVCLLLKSENLSKRFFIDFIIFISASVSFLLFIFLWNLEERLGGCWMIVRMLHPQSKVIATHRKCVSIIHLDDHL